MAGGEDAKDTFLFLVDSIALLVFWMVGGYALIEGLELTGESIAPIVSMVIVTAVVLAGRRMLNLCQNFWPCLLH